MQRKIAFRAWDKWDKKMLYQKDKKDDFVVHLNSIGYEYCEEGGGGIEWKDSKYIILMQYTGLKDKNGKEIYHFDIVKFKSFEPVGDDNLRFGFVQWWDTSAKFAISQYKWITKDGRLIDGEHATGGFPINQTKTDTFEIIGNIYENPELLGGENESENTTD